MSAGEEWRPVPIPELSAVYEVSNLGRIRSLPRVIHQRNGHRLRRPGVVLKLNLVQGYPHTSITLHGKAKNVWAHTLVCRAFHGDPPTPDHQVRHLNGISWDCRAENLAWGTKSENELDKRRHGTHWQARKTRCPRGHLYDEANTIVRKSGARQCRECRNSRRRVGYVADES